MTTLRSHILLLVLAFIAFTALQVAALDFSVNSLVANHEERTWFVTGEVSQPQDQPSLTIQDTLHIYVSPDQTDLIMPKVNEIEVVFYNGSTKVATMRVYTNQIENNSMKQPSLFTWLTPIEQLFHKLQFTITFKFPAKGQIVQMPKPVSFSFAYKHSIAGSPTITASQLAQLQPLSSPGTYLNATCADLDRKCDSMPFQIFLSKIPATVPQLSFSLTGPYQLTAKNPESTKAACQVNDSDVEAEISQGVLKFQHRFLSNQTYILTCQDAPLALPSTFNPDQTDYEFVADAILATLIGSVEEKKVGALDFGDDFYDSSDETSGFVEDGDETVLVPTFSLTRRLVVSYNTAPVRITARGGAVSSHNDRIFSARFEIFPKVLGGDDDDEDKDDKVQVSSFAQLGQVDKINENQSQETRNSEMTVSSTSSVSSSSVSSSLVSSDAPVFVSQATASLFFSGPCPTFFQYFLTDNKNTIVQQGEITRHKNKNGVALPFFAPFDLKFVNATSLRPTGGFNLTITARYDKPQDFSTFVSKLEPENVVKVGFLQTRLTLDYFAPQIKKNVQNAQNDEENVQNDQNQDDEKVPLRDVSLATFQIHRSLSGKKLHLIHQIGLLMAAKAPQVPNNLEVGFIIPLEGKIFNPYLHYKTRFDLYLSLPAGRAYFSPPADSKTFSCRLGADFIVAEVRYDEEGRSLPLKFENLSISKAPISLRCNGDDTVNFPTSKMENTYYDTLQVMVVPLDKKVEGMKSGEDDEDDQNDQNDSKNEQNSQNSQNVSEFDSSDNSTSLEAEIENEVDLVLDEFGNELETEALRYTDSDGLREWLGKGDVEKPQTMVQNYPLRFARDRFWSWEFAGQLIIIGACVVLAVLIVLMCCCKVASDRRQRKRQAQEHTYLNAAGVNGLQYDQME